MADMCRQMQELRSEARMEVAKEISLNMYAKKYPVEDISEIAGVAVELVKVWIEEGK